MGWLWDDHFRHLGHPPKIDRVQDAIFIDNSSSWWRINIIWMKTNWRITICHVFFEKWQQKRRTEKKPLPGMHHTEVQSGDAPKPQFSIKTNNNLEKSENLDSINHPYFWVWFSKDLNPRGHKHGPRVHRPDPQVDRSTGPGGADFETRNLRMFESFKWPQL